MNWGVEGSELEKEINGALWNNARKMAIKSNSWAKGSIETRVSCYKEPLQS